MDTIGVIPNTYKDKDFNYTREIIDWLIQHNKKPIISKQISDVIGMPEVGVTVQQLYTNSDFLLVLGGDGTILRAAKHAAINNIPILGINLGTLGYLTDVEKNECYVALEKVFAGNFILEKRMMLEVTSFSTDSINDNLIALNDVCVTRGSVSSMITLEVYINDQFIDFYKADGVIVSTPTGSTAYNLSAGGPILKPDSKMIAITPICPHMLHIRSFVISGEDKITFKIIKKRENEVILSLDGQNIIQIKDEDVINIRSSSYYTTIIKTNTLSFYEILREKIVGGRKEEKN